MAKPIDNPVDLKLLTQQIKKEGKEKGLTSNELGKRKNKHWNDVYTCLVWSFRIFLLFLGLWIAALLICYLINIANDLEYLKNVVENTIYGILVALATLGGERIITKFFKQDS